MWRVIVGKVAGQLPSPFPQLPPVPGCSGVLAAVLFPGDPGSRWGKEFLIEKEVIHPGFDVRAKEGQGILEFYGDDIALLKLAQKVKMSTHARCLRPGGTVLAGTCALARPLGDLEDNLGDTQSSPQAHLPSLHHGGQHGSAEVPGQHLSGPR